MFVTLFLTFRPPPFFHFPAPPPGVNSQCVWGGGPNVVPFSAPTSAPVPPHNTNPQANFFRDLLPPSLPTSSLFVFPSCLWAPFFPKPPPHQASFFRLCRFFLVFFFPPPSACFSLAPHRLSLIIDVGTELLRFTPLLLFPHLFDFFLWIGKFPPPGVPFFSLPVRPLLLSQTP